VDNEHLTIFSTVQGYSCIQRDSTRGKTTTQHNRSK